MTRLRQIARPSETVVDALVASEDGTVWFRRTRPMDASLTLWAGYRHNGGFVGFVEFPVGKVSDAVAKDAALATKLTEVCAVDIFATGDDGALRIVEDNLDECVLCDLCIEAAPKGGVEVVKLYEK